MRWMAAAIAALLLATSCSTGGGDDEAGPTTTTEAGSAAPTTTGPIGSGPPPVEDGLRIEVLSSQPDRVSGDDARIRVTPGPDHDVGELRVALDDRDVTTQLREVDGGLEGVVTGMIEGNNTLVATAGSDEALQRVRAWPLTGPIIAGPQPPIYRCTTAELGLGPATDDACSAPRTVTWGYVTTSGQVADLPPGGVRPDDLATARIEGAEVPLFVRVERGVLDRSPYEIAVVAPRPDDGALDEGGWNHRLVLEAGGRCGTTYAQAERLASATDADRLRLGYAVLTSAGVDGDALCNDVVAAETAMMVKERAIELLGRPRHTIGVGDRVGAATLHLLVQDYPGIVNGVVATDPLPDVITVLPGAADCQLLAGYAASPTGSALTAAQRAAIAGQASPDACATWVDELFGQLVPTTGCDAAIPEERTYDADARPAGERCTYADAIANQLGTGPDGAVWRTFDNEGLQYGLEALNAGELTVDEFLDLNRAIGGLDADGAPTPQRSSATFDGVARAFETGRVSFAGGDQLDVPIIDIDRYDDASGTLYDHHRPFALRERLTRGGDPAAAPGFQIWTSDAADPRTDAVVADAIAVVDEWLTALAEEAGGGGSMGERLARTRPEAAVDNCLVVGDDAPRRGADVYEGDGDCTQAFPVAADPRIVAGAPRSGHVLKCQLKAPDPSDYDVELTPAQQRELSSVFPTGVCDWFAPSVGQSTPAAPDRSYDDVTSPEQSA